MVHRPASYRVWGEGRARAPTFDPHTIKRMQVPLSPYSPISVLLRQPLSIKKSYAGAIQLLMFVYFFYPTGIILRCVRRQKGVHFISFIIFQRMHSTLPVFHRFLKGSVWPDQIGQRVVLLQWSWPGFPLLYSLFPDF
jgi:hypothetical protein